MSVVLVKFSSASPGYITKPRLLSLANIPVRITAPVSHTYSTCFFSLFPLCEAESFQFLKPQLQHLRMHIYVQDLMTGPFVLSVTYYSLPIMKSDVDG